MKGLLLGCAIAIAPIMQVAAADLGPGIVPSVPYVAIMFNWTGFHIGANVGRGWTRASIKDALHRVSFGVTNKSVFVGGSQIGYDYQVSPTVVLGAEWLVDGVGGGHDSDNALLPAFSDLFEAFATEDFVTALMGRVGFTAPGWDHWVVYVKGGLGWAESQAIVTDLGAGAPFSTADINGGWVAGVDLEWAFAPNWTARVNRQTLGLSGFPLPDRQPSHPTPSPPKAYGIASTVFNGDDVNAPMLTAGVNSLSNGSPNPVLARY